MSITNAVDKFTYSDNLESFLFIGIYYSTKFCLNNVWYYVNNLLLVNKYIILEHIKLKKLIFKKKIYKWQIQIQIVQYQKIVIL